jgi:hypothetical protein
MDGNDTRCRGVHMSFVRLMNTGQCTWLTTVTTLFCTTTELRLATSFSSRDPSRTNN